MGVVKEGSSSDATTTITSTAIDATNTTTTITSDPTPFPDPSATQFPVPYFSADGQCFFYVVTSCVYMVTI